MTTVRNLLANLVICLLIRGSYCGLERRNRPSNTVTARPNYPALVDRPRPQVNDVPPQGPPFNVRQAQQQTQQGFRPSQRYPPNVGNRLTSRLNNIQEFPIRSGVGSVNFDGAANVVRPVSYSATRPQISPGIPTRNTVFESQQRNQIAPLAMSGRFSPRRGALRGPSNVGFPSRPELSSSGLPQPMPSNLGAPNTFDRRRPFLAGAPEYSSNYAPPSIETKTSYQYELAARNANAQGPVRPRSNSYPAPQSGSPLPQIAGPMTIPAAFTDTNGPQPYKRPDRHIPPIDSLGQIENNLNIFPRQQPISANQLPYEPLSSRYQNLVQSKQINMNGLPAIPTTSAAERAAERAAQEMQLEMAFRRGMEFARNQLLSRTERIPNSNNGLPSGTSLQEILGVGVTPISERLPPTIPAPRDPLQPKEEQSSNFGTQTFNMIDRSSGNNRKRQNIIANIPKADSAFLPTETPQESNFSNRTSRTSNPSIPSMFDKALNHLSNPFQGVIISSQEETEEADVDMIIISDRKTFSKLNSGLEDPVPVSEPSFPSLRKEYRIPTQNNTTSSKTDILFQKNSNFLSSLSLNQP